MSYTEQREMALRWLCWALAGVLQALQERLHISTYIKKTASGVLTVGQCLISACCAILPAVSLRCFMFEFLGYVFEHDIQGALEWKLGRLTELQSSSTLLDPVVIRDRTKKREVWCPAPPRTHHAGRWFPGSRNLHQKTLWNRLNRDACFNRHSGRRVELLRGTDENSQNMERFDNP